MNINANEFVLVAVVLLRLAAFFFSFTAFLKFLLRKLIVRNLSNLIFFILLRLEPAFFTHDFVERVRLEVEHVGERAERVDFVVLERIKVEADALQVHDEDIRCLSNHHSLVQINLTIAAVALIVADDFTFKLLLQRLLN